MQGGKLPQEKMQILVKLDHRSIESFWLEKTLRSLSLAVHPAQPSPPLNLSLSATSMCFKYLQ